MKRIIFLGVLLTISFVEGASSKFSQLYPDDLYPSAAASVVKPWTANTGCSQLDLFSSLSTLAKPQRGSRFDDLSASVKLWGGIHLAELFSQSYFDTIEVFEHHEVSSNKQTFFSSRNTGKLPKTKRIKPNNRYSQGMHYKHGKDMPHNKEKRK